MPNYAHPPPSFVFIFGDVWPTPEPLSAVLGTTVLWVQGIYVITIVVPSTADRGSGVGQMSHQFKDEGVGDAFDSLLVHYSMGSTDVLPTVSKVYMRDQIWIC